MTAPARAQQRHGARRRRPAGGRGRSASHRRVGRSAVSKTSLTATGTPQQRQRVPRRSRSSASSSRARASARSGELAANERIAPSWRAIASRAAPIDLDGAHLARPRRARRSTRRPAPSTARRAPPPPRTLRGSAAAAPLCVPRARPPGPDALATRPTHAAMIPTAASPADIVRPFTSGERVARLQRPERDVRQRVARPPEERDRREQAVRRSPASRST